MSFQEIHEDAILTGTGYCNLTDDSSFKGQIALYGEWAIIRNENAQYSVPRRRIDFINWKKTPEIEEAL